MEKDKLKSIVNNMCKELLTIIDEEKEATKEQVSNYLKESAQIFANVKEDKVSASGYAESLFHNVYKDIANKSLSSYSDTNKNIKKLTQMHEETLLECNQPQIDLPMLRDKFNEIQNHMSKEVEKANAMISKLTTQVKTLEDKSHLDSLTKVFNRRALSSYLENICSKDKLAYDLHMLMIDIDDFKVLNDTYGHIAGDKVLIFIANLLKKTLRDGDKIFRYGGEEFIIILNRLDDIQCKSITNRLLQLVRESNLIYKGESLSVTMSVGTTKYSQNDTPDSFISRADKALYKAKNNGKDQMQSEVI